MKKGLLEATDYEKVNSNLKMMFQPLPPSENASSLLCHDPPPPAQNLDLDPFRYQNLTKENYGYVGNSVNVKPYGIAKYTFVAQFDNELSLSQGRTKISVSTLFL